MSGTTKKKLTKGAGARPSLSYGFAEVDLSALKADEVKIRISTFLDEDVLLGLKKIATHRGTRYQTLMNTVLRSFVESSFAHHSKKPSPFEDAVRKIVQDELKKRG